MWTTLPSRNDLVEAQVPLHAIQDLVWIYGSGKTFLQLSVKIDQLNSRD
jgi:hypothetical protein